MRKRTLNTLAAIGVWLVIVLFIFGAYIAFLEIARPRPQDQGQGNPHAENNSGVGTPPGFQPKPQGNQQSGNYGNSDSDIKLTDWIQAISAALIVGLTVAILFVYGSQTKIMKRQARRMRQTIKSMDDTAERQLRAYLAIATQSDPPGAAQGGITINPGRIEVRLFIKNCGQTPAYAMRDWCNIVIVPTAQIARLPKLRKRVDDATSVIAPGQVITVGRDKVPGFNDADRAIMARGPSLIYIYGTITYRDAFAKKRYLRFRYCTGTATGRSDGLMIAAQGNTAN